MGRLMVRPVIFALPANACKLADRPLKKRMCVACRAAAKKRRLDRRKSLFCTRFFHCLKSAAAYDAVESAWLRDSEFMTPEEKAREQIDAMLKASGWAVQTKDKINLSAARGVAVCELSFVTGEPDCTLFVDAKSLGTVEAKPEGHSLVGVEEQSTKYVTGVPAGLPSWHNPLPFCYESTGSETRFTNRLDPDPRSRNVFAFHRPETLLAWVQQEKQLAQRLRELPPLAVGSLWLAQIEAITGLDKSFAAGLLRALIQMATGSGKTYTAVNFNYRLVKYAGACRVRFLVDRGNLGRQTLKEFQQFVSPVNNYKFTEEYIVQHLTSNMLDSSARDRKSVV